MSTATAGAPCAARASKWLIWCLLLTKKGSVTSLARVSPAGTDDGAKSRGHRFSFCYLWF
eukprot:jgi/Botrbrau1/18823/Bobra.0841s0003.1